MRRTSTGQGDFYGTQVPRIQEYNRCALKDNLLPSYNYFRYTRSAIMTATVGFHFFDYEITNKHSELLSYCSDLAQPQVESVLCLSAKTLFSTSATLLNREVSGPSAVRLYQRRHSEYIHTNNLISSFRMDTPALNNGSNNIENCFRERSYSETRERLKPTTYGFTTGGSSQSNSSRYKTELCRPFEEDGFCKYGDKCQFAHGHHELRSLSRHPKYKTELCRTFHTAGFCPYGPRCHFIHNAEECRGPPPLSTFNKLQRPHLQYSWSFAGFPSLGGISDDSTSVTSPPLFSTEELTEWPVSTPAYPSQEFGSLFWPSIGGPPALERPASPIMKWPMSESPPSPTDSVSDHEGYQSSLGSCSDSESPVLDATCRLPIFSRLSISDD
ncbi:mRNA decay activator protein ZFP36L1b [Brachyhypopomus gauderio]|uniref:mRNA decay activator protein ZFP36L1b n=1 Tax=Brachyhypopomus gauderio TaxID=698409 RepID=UPI0040425B09